MTWKRILVFVGAAISCLVSLPLAGTMANWFYMHFIFQGDVSDFAPGDSFGVLLWTIIFMPPFLLAIFLVSRGILQKLTQQR